MTATVCEHCGEPLRGKRAHARFCDSSCRADATRVRQELAGGDKESAQKRSGEQRGTAKEWQETAELAILNFFVENPGEDFHADDLQHVIPDEHRGVISLAVMALVNKKLITGCGYRKSAIPSRKRSPSQEYRLTEQGRDRLAGKGAPKSVPSTQGIEPGVSTVGSVLSGEVSSVHGRQHAHDAGEPRPTTAEVVPLFEEGHQPLSLVTDPEAA